MNVLICVYKHTQEARLYQWQSKQPEKKKKSYTSFQVDGYAVHNAKWLLWYGLTVWNKMWHTVNLTFLQNFEKVQKQQFKQYQGKSNGPLCCSFDTFRVQIIGTCLHTEVLQSVCSLHFWLPERLKPFILVFSIIATRGMKSVQFVFVPSS